MGGGGGGGGGGELRPVLITVVGGQGIVYRPHILLLLALYTIPFHLSHVSPNYIQAYSAVSVHSSG